MTRSPLAYPLNRSADTDVGGAADLQTDIMRFMAILALCLVAIFALVQSIPLAAVAPEVPVAAEPVPAEPVAQEEAPPVQPVVHAAPAPPVSRALPAAPDESNAVTLTRPKWVPRFQPADPVVTEAPRPDEAVVTDAPQPAEPAASTTALPPTETQGFTLRFASDAALMRAVAASHVGLYAIEDGNAQRMTVSSSRISFWSASTPNTFHEMEAATVPVAVVDALARSGADTDAVNWGVTLPGKMKTRLDALMQAHSGGSLIIGAAGDIHWEAT